MCGCFVVFFACVSQIYNYTVSLSFFCNHNHLPIYVHITCVFELHSHHSKTRDKIITPNTARVYNWYNIYNIVLYLNVAANYFYIHILYDIMNEQNQKKQYNKHPNKHIKVMDMLVFSSSGWTIFNLRLVIVCTLIRFLKCGCFRRKATILLENISWATTNMTVLDELTRVTPLLQHWVRWANTRLVPRMACDIRRQTSTHWMAVRKVYR